MTSRLLEIIAQCGSISIAVMGAGEQLVGMFVDIVTTAVGALVRLAIGVLNWTGQYWQGLLGLASVAVGADSAGLIPEEPNQPAIVIEAPTEPEWHNLEALQESIVGTARAANEDRERILSTLLDRMDRLWDIENATERVLLEQRGEMRTAIAVHDQTHVALTSTLEDLKNAWQTHERRTGERASSGDSEVATLRLELEQLKLRTAEIRHAVEMKCGRVLPTCPSGDGDGVPTEPRDPATWTQIPFAIGPTCTRSDEGVTADGGRWKCGIGFTLDLPRAIRLVR